MSDAKLDHSGGPIAGRYAAGNTVVHWTGPSPADCSARGARFALLRSQGDAIQRSRRSQCLSCASSLGGIGGTHFTPIINAPEVAILGLSKSAMKPVWDGQQFVPRLMLPLSLSYDHRVIDGALAARFNAYLGQVLADYRRILL